MFVSIIQGHVRAVDLYVPLKLKQKAEFHV